MAIVNALAPLPRANQRQVQVIEPEVVYEPEPARYWHDAGQPKHLTRRGETRPCGNSAPYLRRTGAVLEPYHRNSTPEPTRLLDLYA